VSAMLLFLLILAMCALVVAYMAAERAVEAQNELSDLTRNDRRLGTELLQQARREVDRVARGQDQGGGCRHGGPARGPRGPRVRRSPASGYIRRWRRW